jgi:two-component system sensor histidine kinase KdpD
VSVDPVQMERAFVNVLENARRHSGGHPVSVRARAVRDRVIVRIVDRGPGIPPAQLERVFEPFYRAGTPGSAHRGSGLGLAIARGFTEANAGSLHVESLPGQGATFVFEMPLQQIPADGHVDVPPGAGAAATVATDEARTPVSPGSGRERAT